MTGHLEMCQTLLAAGADPLALDDFGWYVHFLRLVGVVMLARSRVHFYPFSDCSHLISLF